MKHQDNQRLVSFRLTKDMADKLIALGLLKEGYNRKELNQLVREIFEGELEGKKPEVTTRDEVRTSIDYLSQVIEQQSQQINRLMKMIELQNNNQRSVA